MAGAAQQGNSSDNSMGIIWVIGCALVFLIIIWTIFRKAIVTFYFYLKLYEINLLSLFTSKLADVRSTIITVLNGDPSLLPPPEVLRVGEAVGEYLRYPLVFILIILAMIVYFSSSTRIFKRTYSMRDLVQEEKMNWPQIAPVANLDLVKTDIDKGPWAMALTPMQFCKRYNLLEEYRRAPTDAMLHKDRNKIEVNLKRGATNRIFSIQLGAVWPGIDRLPLHIKALFGIFGARLNGETKAATELLARINSSAQTKLNFTGAEELCRKQFNTKLVQKIVNSHAYLLTVMAEMLAAARSDGVQASADFLWLKPVDRKLWYMLNTVGRQTPFVEVAGPFAHWTAEREIGRRLLVPMVEEATRALEIALKDIVYKPDDPDEQNS